MYVTCKRTQYTFLFSETIPCKIKMLPESKIVYWHVFFIAITGMFLAFLCASYSVRVFCILESCQGYCVSFSWSLTLCLNEFFDVYFIAMNWIDKDCSTLFKVLSVAITICKYRNVSFRYIGRPSWSCTSACYITPVISPMREWFQCVRIALSFWISH